MLAKTYGWSHDSMMKLSPLQIRAYHTQIHRMQSADDVRIMDAVRVAFHATSSDYTEHRRELAASANGEEASKVSIANNAALASFIASSARGSI